MRISAILAVCALFVWGCAAAPGVARAGMVEDCEQRQDSHLQISGCTAVIRSGKWSGKELARAYNNRGIAYRRLGRTRKAIDDYDRALRLDPNLADTYNNRGYAYYGLGEVRKAIRDFDRAIQLDPHHVDAYNNRGAAYHGLGEHRKALEDYDRVLILDPDYARAYHNRGLAYKAIGDVGRAVSDWEAAIRLFGPPGVKRWQEYLKKTGHYAGAVDGIYGSDTRAGLEACARDPAC